MLNNIKFDVSCPNNTWVFASGKMANGTNIQGYRTYIRHFEEIIRWENSGDDKLKYGKQRFVINVSNEGDTVAIILNSYDDLIKPLGTKMVAIMVGLEDCKAGTPINIFKLDLRSLIRKIFDEDKVPVIMTSHAVLDMEVKEQLVKYTAAIKEVATLEKISIVDFYKIWSDKGEGYIASRLSEDGILPNEMGHLDMGKQLANSVGSKVSNTGPMNSIVIMFNDSKVLQYEDLRGLIVNSNSTGFAGSFDTTGTYKIIQDRIASDKPITWMFIGDSITHGALWTYGYDDFTQLFEKRVRNEMGRTRDIVINTGVSGATTREFIENKDSRFARYNLDIAFIMFGMNDCVTISEEEFETNLEEIINDMRGKNVIPILRTPNIAPGRIHELPAYIEVIRKVAQQKHVMLIDHFKEWTDITMTIPIWEQWVNAADSSMKIHPTSLGHLNMAQSIFRAIGIYDSQSELCTLGYSSIAIPNNRNTIVDGRV